MILSKYNVFGVVSAALLSGAMVGCGGSSASVQGAGGTVQTTGGLTTTSQTFTSGVGSSTAPQQVQVTVNGTQQNATLPPGESIGAGQSVAVLPPTQIIVGLAGPQARTKKAAPTTGSAGEVDVDGQNTGLTVTSGGALSGYLILVPGTHTVTAYGPFTIVGGSAFHPTQLTVGKFVFKVIVLADGTPSTPSALTLNLPVDGGSISHGSYVTAGYSSEFSPSYSGTLTITYAGTSILKSQALVVNPTTGLATATYNALSSHPAIPSGGVDTVEFDINP
jgi:hypothetical protein